MDLRLSQITVRFQGVAALQGLSADFAPGSRALVLGGASSGKTTLLKVLAGLRPPDEGQVLWDGRDTRSLDLQQRRAGQTRFGMVFQSDALFDSMTVLQNVLLPLRRKLRQEEARKAAVAVLGSVGLGDALDTYPERLSGGMRKRAGLARALVAQPEVLLADDPLAGLDPATGRQVAELLAAFAQGRTLIVASPEPLPFLEFPRWLFLRRGRLVHDGPPAPAMLDEPEEAA